MPSESLSLTLVVNPDVLAAMPGADISIVLAKLEESGFGAFLQQAGFIMERYQRQNFDDFGETFGDPWADLKPDTISEKMALGYPATSEVRTGNLRDQMGAYQVQSSGNTITTGLDLEAAPYGAEQDAGDPRRNLPARIMVAFSASERSDLEEALETMLQELGLPPGAITIEESLATA